MNKVNLDYFTDTLCIWAYVAQIRLDELRNRFGDTLIINEHFITLFGDTPHRIGEGWSDRGGFDGFARHVQDVAEQFPHISLHPSLWKKVRPFSSANSHLYIKAMQRLTLLSDLPADTLRSFIHSVREAFFIHGEDIGRLDVVRSIASSMDLPVKEADDLLNNGEAMSALFEDAAMKEKFRLEGSPTYLLNNGRQKLYGNVGYRILEANILELQERPEGIASWC